MNLWNGQDLGIAGCITDLKPNFFRPISIKALVTFKSSLINVPYSKGEKRFYLILKDRTGQIQASGFEDTYHFYDYIQENKLYLLSGFEVKQAHLSNKTCHPYQIIFRKASLIERINDDSFKQLVNAIPDTIGDIDDYKPISKIRLRHEYASVLAICVRATEIIERPSIGNFKRDLLLQDHSGRITLSLWGRHAKKYNFFKQPVVCVQGATVREYEGNLELNTDMVLVNPPDPGVEDLCEWWSSKFECSSDECSGSEDEE